MHSLNGYFLTFVLQKWLDILLLLFRLGSVHLDKAVDVLILSLCFIKFTMHPAWPTSMNAHKSLHMFRRNFINKDCTAKFSFKAQ